LASILGGRLSHRVRSYQPDLGRYLRGYQLRQYQVALI
jgi:hypothetical protein